MDIFADDEIEERIERIKEKIRESKNKKEKKRLEKELDNQKKKLAEITKKIYLLSSMYQPEAIIKCMNCEKELKEKDAAYGYNQFFCVECYLKFAEHARKEVEKIIGYL